MNDYYNSGKGARPMIGLMVIAGFGVVLLLCMLAYQLFK